MTSRELLNKINTEKPNSFSDSQLVAFVNEIEVEVAEQMRIENVPVYSADDEESMAQTLLAPAPYDRLYVSYVKAMVDYANEEYGSYANNQAQHVQDFRDFTDWVVRENKAHEQSTPTRLRNVY